MTFLKIFAVVVFTFGSINLGLSQLSEGWFGSYSGTLVITNFKGEQSEIYMELLIERNTDSSYTFNIIYGEDTTRQIRKYELFHENDNQYKLDEKNGIVLPMMLFNKRLISVFEVQGNLLQVSYALDKKNIIFRTTVSRESMESGGEGDIPLVQGFTPTVDQYATLKRKK